MKNTFTKYILLVLILLIIFQIYVFTTFPSYKNNDSPETAACAYSLGIAHPPSYPFFNMAAKIATLIPVGNPAFRVNLFSSFLAIMALLISFFLVEKSNKFIFNREYAGLGYISVVILAFSSVFWSQAIEAKGGIYMLNLVFFLILLYVSISLLEEYAPRKLYMMTYIIALSLSNHWPSTVIIGPVFVWFYYKYRAQMNGKSVLIHLVLFAVGVSSYIYLPVRAGVDGVFAFMAKPDSWGNFWWTVLRSGYTEGTKSLSEVLLYQFVEGGRVMLKDYSFLGVFVILGLYGVYKNRKSVWYLYGSIFALVVVFVMIFNRAAKDILWVIGIFMLPALYVMLLLIAAGMAQAVNLVKIRAMKVYPVIVMAAVSLFLPFSGYNENNNRENFLFYDFSLNLQKTLTKGSFYLPEGDFYNMTMPYSLMVEKKLRDINYITLFSLQHKWGTDAFKKKYGDLGMDPRYGGLNAIKAIGRFSETSDVFISNYAKQLESELPGKLQKTDGILFKMSGKDEKIPVSVFQRYSYRGIFDAKNYYDKSLVATYGLKMAEQAFDYYKMNDFRASVMMNESALKMPGTYSNGSIHYNLSLAYYFLMDRKNELKSLKNAVKYAPEYWPAYENAGKAYYALSNLPMAKQMFEKAVKYGSPNKAYIQANLDAINKTDFGTQCGTLYNKAVSLLAQDDFEGAMDMFEYLLNNKLNNSRIYMNIGTYFYKKERYNDSYAYFLKSLEAGSSPEIFLYLAYSLFKMERKSEGLKYLERGISLYGNDMRLRSAYAQLSKQ